MRSLVLEAIRICNRCGYVSPSRLMRELDISYELATALAELVRGPTSSKGMVAEAMYYRRTEPDPFVLEVGP